MRAALARNDGWVAWLRLLFDALVAALLLGTPPALLVTLWPLQRDEAISLVDGLLFPVVVAVFFSPLALIAGTVAGVVQRRWSPNPGATATALAAMAAAAAGGLVWFVVLVAQSGGPFGTPTPVEDLLPAPAVVALVGGSASYVLVVGRWHAVRALRRFDAARGPLQRSVV